MKKSILCSLVLLCQGLHAQTNSEHADLWQYQKNKRLYVPEQLTFLVGQSEEFGKLQVEYQKTKGAYRRSQEANTKRQYQFDVEGFTDIDRFKAYGRFTFTKRFEDGVANDLRGKKNDFQPFYYYANYPNYMQNQNYFANTMFSYELVQNKLFVGFGIDFDHHWTTGNRDPRPDVVNYFIRYKWELAYRIQNHLVGLGYAKGRMSEENNIIFKNDEYKSANKYPDRFINISLGYGDIVLSDNNLKLKREGWENSLNAAYQYTTNQIDVKVYASSKKYTEEAELNKYSETVNVYNRYTSNELALKSLFTYSASAKKEYQFGLEYFRYDGQNKRQVEGINYEVEHATLSASLQASIQEITQKLDIEFGVMEHFITTERRDFAIGNRIHYQGLLNTIFVNGIYKQNTHFYRVSLMPMYQMKLNNDMQLEATQETNFTRQVILPDYVYYNHNAAGVRGELGFGTKELIQRYCLYFSIAYQYLGANSSNRNTVIGTVNLYL